MDAPSDEVIVATTLYLMSGYVFDPSPCACRAKAIAVHLEKMLQMPALDPVLRATAIQLHEAWTRVAAGIDAIESDAVSASATRH